MRKILATILAMIGLLSTPEAWGQINCPASGDMAMAGKGKCACCVNESVCGCDHVPDQTPNSVPLPATPAQKAPSYPCLHFSSSDIAIPRLSVAGHLMMAMRDTARREGIKVPMFILHCAPLC